MLDIIFSVIFAWIIFKETPALTAIIGGILIMIENHIIISNKDFIEIIVD